MMRLFEEIAKQEHKIMSDQVKLRDELVAWIANLRAFALSLTQSAQHSDDLVQETLVKALSNLDKFEMGSNLRAWLFTILRNSFYNEIRHRKYHQTASLDEIDSEAIELHATQEKYVGFKDVLRGLGRLVPEQREAIVLIAAEGLSYEEAAAICKCPVGTVKSRLSRARQRLEEYANGEKIMAVPGTSVAPFRAAIHHLRAGKSLPAHLRRASAAKRPAPPSPSECRIFLKPRRRVAG